MKEVLVIKEINKLKQNEYEEDNKTAHIKLSKKDGSTTNTIIDIEDLKKVLDKGIWFTRWHKDFNNYIVQTNEEVLVSGKKRFQKITLQSFLLDVHTNAPIRHINGNTLDNRKSNLEIYQQNKVNDYTEFDPDTIALILRDKYGKEHAKALIDKDYLPKVLNTGHCWVLYKSEGKNYAVANTPRGRIYLNKFIMKVVDDSKIHAINLNYLDNRKKNLEVVTVEKPDSKNDDEVVKK